MPPQQRVRTPLALLLQWAGQQPSRGPRARDRERGQLQACECCSGLSLHLLAVGEGEWRQQRHHSPRSRPRSPVPISRPPATRTGQRRHKGLRAALTLARLQGSCPCGACSMQRCGGERGVALYNHGVPGVPGGRTRGAAGFPRPLLAPAVRAVHSGVARTDIGRCCALPLPALQGAESTAWPCISTRCGFLTLRPLTTPTPPSRRLRTGTITTA